MTYCMIRQAGSILAVIGCVLVQPVFGVDRSNGRERQAASRDERHQQFQSDHVDRYAQLNEQSQKIVQLKQSIEKDRQRVARLRRQLRKVRAEIKHHRSAAGVVAGTNQSDRVRSDKYRSNMAALKMKMNEAVEAQDDQRVEALRRRLAHLKSTRNQRRDVQQARADQYQKMIQRFEDRIRVAKESYQLDRAEALQNRLNQLKASARDGGVFDLARRSFRQPNRGKSQHVKQKKHDWSKQRDETRRNHLIKEARDSDVD